MPDELLEEMEQEITGRFRTRLEEVISNDTGIPRETLSRVMDDIKEAEASYDRMYPHPRVPGGNRIG